MKHIWRYQLAWRRSRRTRSERPGATMIEVLLVCGIVAALVGLMLPAAQQVRAASWNAACKNHLRQVGIAGHHFESTHGFLPTNGGGPASWILDIHGQRFRPWESITTVQTLSKYHAVGDPNANARSQGGSFFFSVMPQMGYGVVYQQRDWTAAVPLYVCPARRSSRTRVPPTRDEYGEYIGGGWAWGHSDYAANLQAVGNFGTPLRSTERMTDGLACTILAGEKAMNPKNYESGTWLYDSPFFFGGTLGTSRGLTSTIVKDGPDFTFAENWGSAHPSAANFVFGDGSVRPLTYQHRSAVVKSLLTPAAGD